ncbi:MAG: hypothetical protein WKG00_01945 [Polyangiaceae bacterium]
MKRLATTTLLAGLLVTTAVGADDPRTTDDSSPDLPACVRAYEQAQVLRQAGKLRAAREQLIVCVRGTCPAVARQDCTTWLDAVEASLPSLAVSVVDAQGAAALDATLTIDGAPVDWGSGRAIAVDPGRHEVRAQRRGGERAAATVLVVEGQRNQPLLLTLGGAPAPAPGPAVVEADASAPVAPWIFAGVTLLGVGGFAGFGVAALSRESALADGCGTHHRCSEEEIDGVRTLRIASGISLGVGIAGAAGLALSLLLAGDGGGGRAAPRGTRSRLRPWAGGDVAGVAMPF